MGISGGTWSVTRRRRQSGELLQRLLEDARVVAFKQGLRSAELRGSMRILLRNQAVLGGGSQMSGMARRRPVVEFVIARAPRLKAATNRAIDAVLGKKRAPVKPPWPGAGEVEEAFRAARRGET